jgi:hypothetical protein
MRYGSGKDFKIGCTENISRRQSQIDMMSPDDGKTDPLHRNRRPEGHREILAAAIF